MTDDDDFAALFAQTAQGQAKPGAAVKRPKPGDLVTGVITSIGKDALFVDLGGKAEGVLDREQVVADDGTIRLKVGDKVEARVAGERGGALVLRVRMARGSEAKAELVSALELGIPVEGKVNGVIKGGLDVDVAGVRGFCPASQVDAKFVADQSVFVGQRLQFRVTQYERGNLVLSRRALLEEDNAKKAEALKDKLEVGAVLRGRVTGFKPFGAFVDLGGLEGMLHVSELGHSRVDKPEDVLALGQELDVQVKSIEPAVDGKRPRIALSIKALMDDPWGQAVKSLTAGATVTGTVTRLQPFGAFVEVLPTIEGLVHVSELGAGRRINHPKEVVAVGQTVEVIILGIDADKRRVSLSMAAAAKQTEANELAEARAMVRPAPTSLGTLADLFNKKK